MKVKELLHKLHHVPDKYLITSGKLNTCTLCTLTFSNKDLDRTKTYFQRAKLGDISSRPSLALIISNKDDQVTVGDLKAILIREDPELDIVVGTSDSQCFCSEFYFYTLGQTLKIL